MYLLAYITKKVTCPQCVAFLSVVYTHTGMASRRSIRQGRNALSRIRTATVYHKRSGLGGIPLGILYDWLLPCLDPQSLTRIAAVLKAVKSSDRRWEMQWNRLWDRCGLDYLAKFCGMAPSRDRCYQAFRTICEWTHDISTYKAYADHAECNISTCAARPAVDRIRNAGAMIPIDTSTDCRCIYDPCRRFIIMAGSRDMLELTTRMMQESKTFGDPLTRIPLADITERFPLTFQHIKGHMDMTRDTATEVMISVVTRCRAFHVDRQVRPGSNTQTFKMVVTAPQKHSLATCRDVRYMCRYYLVGEPDVCGNICRSCNRGFRLNP